MEDIKIVGFTSYDSNYPNINFKEYDQNYILSLFIQDIKDNNYKYSGETHQNSDSGVPLFSNGCCLRCSMRAFAMIMAIAIDNDANNYMDYYMSFNDENIPTNIIDIEKGLDNDALPVLVGLDQQLILDSINNGMDLMTLDKALNQIYPLYKNKYSN